MDIKNLNIVKVFEDIEKDLRKDYDILFSIIKTNNSSAAKLGEEDLVHLVRQFHVVVVKLNRNHVHLVSEVLKFDWMTGSMELNEEFHSFVLDLLSVHFTHYIHECLTATIKNFVPGSLVDPTSTYSDLPEDGKAKVMMASQRVHDLLQKIIKAFPSATLYLESLFVRFCPPLMKLSSQDVYMMNLLQATEYLPQMTSHIMTLVVTTMIALDTEATKAEILRLEEAARNDAAGIYENGGQLEQTKTKNTAANTLDCMMVVMFEFIREHSFKNGELVWPALKRLYLEFRKIFEMLLLKTSGTLHVQFIMFHLCSLKLDIAVDFVEFLWCQVTSLNKDIMQRQLAASYLGSYLARAKHLPTRIIKCQLVRMKEWIHKYLENCSNPFRASFHMHGVFYMVCQSFFYAIVFRHKHIIDNPQGQKFCMGLYLQKMVSCHLNPLRFCYLPIAETFCAVVRNNHIAFCDNILEKNRRTMVAFDEEDAGSFLVPFFPFDPCLLPKTKETIGSSYLDYDDSVLKLETRQETLAEEVDYMEFDASVNQISQAIDMELSPRINQFSLHNTPLEFHH